MTMYCWKAAGRGLGKGEGVAGRGRESLLPSIRKKNKLPGEAVPQPGAVTSTAIVVTASICLAFRSGGGCRRVGQVCIGREASDTTLPTITAWPDRCDRDSLLQKPSARLIFGPALQGRLRPWRYSFLSDLTLAKANCKSKSIKVLDLNNVLANQVLGSGSGRHRAK
jgi:hypothetical protein